MLENSQIFISYYHGDYVLASQINAELERLGIQTHLEKLTSNKLSSEILTDRLKTCIRDSSDLLVVMSESTKNSWWVPFEIGMAADEDLPTATYLVQSAYLPEYLDYWPRLKSIYDLLIYVQEIRKRKIKPQLACESSGGPRYTTNAFYTDLKRALS